MPQLQAYRFNLPGRARQSSTLRQEAAARQAAGSAGAHVGILLDLQGPKIRLGRFENGTCVLETGAFFTITRTLRNYFLDRKVGAFPTRVSTLIRRPPRPDVSGAA